MKKLLSISLALLMGLTAVGCSSNTPSGSASPAPAEGGEGKVLNVWTWNTEFWGFLGKYYADEVVDEYTLKKGDVTIKRTTYPSDDGAYQNALDEALLNQATAVVLAYERNH